MRVFITRKIPGTTERMLREAGHLVTVSTKARPLSKRELIRNLSEGYDAAVTLLTDQVDADVFEKAPALRIVANYAVGFNNIDLAAAKTKKIMVTNTPGVANEAVAEHTLALMLALTTRLAEGDRLARAGKYKGWDPLLLIGSDVHGKTLGVIGTGAIGSHVVRAAVHGLSMKAIYFDVKRNEKLEQETGARFCATPEEVLREADVISLHVPLLPTTHHLINSTRLALMKKTAYLINTARGPIVDEAALTEALARGGIAGAALDVFEKEPAMSRKLRSLQNVVLTPHIASARESVREDMCRMVAESIIDLARGVEVRHQVPLP